MSDRRLVTLILSVSFAIFACYAYFVKEQVMSAIFLALIAVVFALLFDGLGSVKA